ncbi:hypothetical protein PAHAL_2G178800 [Panicum hallii]|uniref:Uncharacterized protein n=1 Tax=Panicum hallii TaxID=206008 RepID=A0A2T8KPI9_9POAL|nr:hypothetical protein PAHAL_2G178800 [Panicum hallii]
MIYEVTIGKNGVLIMLLPGHPDGGGNIGRGAHTMSSHRFSSTRSNLSPLVPTHSHPHQSLSPLQARARGRRYSSRCSPARSWPRRPSCGLKCRGAALRRPPLPRTFPRPGHCFPARRAWWAASGGCRGA